MLNSKNFNDILISTPAQVITLLNSKISATVIPFNDIDKFPKKHGIYFVFLDDTILYIGKADKQTIQKRCKQRGRMGKFVRWVER